MTLDRPVIVCDVCGVNNSCAERGHWRICPGDFQDKGTEVYLEVNDDMSFTGLRKICLDTSNNLVPCRSGYYTVEYVSRIDFDRSSHCLIKAAEHQDGELIARILKIDNGDAYIYCNESTYHIIELLKNVISGRYTSIHIPDEYMFVCDWLYDQYYYTEGGLMIEYDGEKTYIHHPTKVLPRITKLMDCTIQFDN